MTANVIVRVERQFDFPREQVFRAWTEAKNVRTPGGDPRTGQVLGREAAGRAIEAAMATARGEAATVLVVRPVDDRGDLEVPEDAPPG